MGAILITDTENGDMEVVENTVAPAGHGAKIEVTRPLVKIWNDVTLGLWAFDIGEFLALTRMEVAPTRS